MAHVRAGRYPLTVIARACVLMAALWSSASASPASADDRVDEGWRRYEEADFEGALAAFDEAEAGDDLDLPGLVRLLEGRALVHFANDELDTMRFELSRLANVAPDHRMADDVPPEVRSAFQEERGRSEGPVRLEVTAAMDGDAVLLTGTAHGDGTGVVREVRVHARSATGGWTTGRGSARLERADPADVRCWAEAIGPGRVVLATRGAPDAPLPIELEVDVGGAAGVHPAIVWGSVGAAVVLGVVLIAVLSGSGTRKVQPSAPTVSGLRRVGWP